MEPSTAMTDSAKYGKVTMSVGIAKNKFSTFYQTLQMQLVIYGKDADDINTCIWLTPE